MARYIKADELNLTNFEIFMCKGDYKKALELMLEKIANATTEDVAPVVRANLKNWRCTNCNMELPAKNAKARDEIVWQYAGEMNYCPNCGAKMDEWGE